MFFPILRVSGAYFREKSFENSWLNGAEFLNSFEILFQDWESSRSIAASSGSLRDNKVPLENEGQFGTLVTME